MVGKSDEGEMTGVIERVGGERVWFGGESETSEDPTQPREPDPHSQWTERDSERGEGEVSQDSTHSMRKTKSSVIYEKTKNVDAIQRLLGHASVSATSAYLWINDNEATDLARSINIWFNLNELFFELYPIC